MMAERLVYQVIEDGIAFLVANPQVIRDFLTSEMGLDAAEAELVSGAFLATKGQTGTGLERPGPSVVHGYARQETVFPAYAITLGGEQESQTFVGNEGGHIDDPEDEDFGADQFAAIFSYQLNILVYTQHPDLTLYLYQLLKNILVAAIPLFTQNDLFDVRFSGADLAPDPAWAPAGLFLRRVTLAFNRQYTQTQVSTKLGRAWRVQSIHIDAQGDVGADVGGVLTHVTTPEEEP